jgi:hypothetical protein
MNYGYLLERDPELWKTVPQPVPVDFREALQRLFPDLLVRRLDHEEEREVEGLGFARFRPEDLAETRKGAGSARLDADIEKPDQKYYSSASPFSLREKVAEGRMRGQER